MADDKRDADVDLDVGATEGGQEPEQVEDRPNVSTVKPEDYPPG